MCVCVFARAFGVCLCLKHVVWDVHARMCVLLVYMCVRETCGNIEKKREMEKEKKREHGRERECVCVNQREKETERNI